MAKIWARIEVSFTSEHFDRRGAREDLQRGIDAMTNALPAFPHMEGPQPYLVWLEVRREWRMIRNKRRRKTKKLPPKLAS